MGYPEEPYDPPEVEAFHGAPGGDGSSQRALRNDVPHRFSSGGDGGDLIEDRMIVRQRSIDEGIVAGRLTRVRGREFLHSQQFNYGEDWGQRASSQTENKRRNTMKSSTKDQAEGKFHKVKGKIKEIAGKVSENPKLEAEGKDEKRAGKVQEKIGQIKNVLGK